MPAFFTKPGRTDDIGLSQSLWHQCPLENIRRDPSYGTYFYDNFEEGGAALSSNTVTLRRWTGYADTGSTITGRSGAWTKDTANGVVVNMDDTDNDLVVLQAGKQTGAGGAFGISDTAGDNCPLWMEAGFEVGSIAASVPSVFVGLAAPNLNDADNEIFSDSDAFAQVAHLGFLRPTGDPDSLDIVYGAASQTPNTHADAWQAVAASTLYRVGLHFNGKKITPYFNGVEYAANAITVSDIATADFPDAERLTPTFFVKCATGATQTAALTMRFFCVAQRAY